MRQQPFLLAVAEPYSYFFKWLNLPIIIYPQDIATFQELVSRIQPDLIVKTG
jgi:cephalosporin hydroxylase